MYFYLFFHHCNFLYTFFPFLKQNILFNIQPIIIFEQGYINIHHNPSCSFKDYLFVYLSVNPSMFEFCCRCHHTEKHTFPFRLHFFLRFSSTSPSKNIFVYFLVYFHIHCLVLFEYWIFELHCSNTDVFGLMMIPLYQNHILFGLFMTHSVCSEP